MKKIKTLFNLILISFLSISCTAQDNLKDGLYAKINTTKGSITVKLEMEKTPMTVANFVGLAEGKIPNTAKPAGTPFYNGVTFHRVIANFMIQGGDPSGTGAGDIGYEFRDEIHPSLKHDRAGTLSMANKGKGTNTNSSQFFITHKDTPWLDGAHSVFGYVIEGQGTVDLIREGDVIKNIEIIRRGDKAESFDALKVFNEMQ